MTAFTVCYSPLGWQDRYAISAARPQPGCGHRHRTVEAAERCNDRLQPPAALGGYLNTRILAVDPLGGYRRLTETEANPA